MAMRITHVSAENLKGHSFRFDLEPGVAVVGRNFSGKTALIDAIRLGIIGYLPELGKLPKATRQLMSDEFMAVHLEFDNGANADFEINEKQEHELPWAIHRAEIPLLNAAAYSAMTERERYQYVFEIAKTPEAFTWPSIIAELHQMAFLGDAHIQEAKRKMIAFVATLDLESVQIGLQMAIDKMAEHFKYYNARAKDTQGAVREYESAAAHVTVTKAIGKVLRDKQAALVDAVFGSLLKVANGIVGEILPSSLAFHEGDVGRWNGHHWISHQTFSGTEQALTFVAIAAALSQGAPIRLLIFDELGRLDRERRMLLLNLLQNAITAGWIDQFIVAGTEDSMPEALPASIQMIQL